MISCPFCGNKVIYLKRRLNKEQHFRQWYQCNSCRARGPEAQTPSSAEWRWSNRVQDQAEKATT